eukprot:11400179-Alexandrium_andersonii.AAC.1
MCIRDRLTPVPPLPLARRVPRVTGRLPLARLAKGLLLDAQPWGRGQAVQYGDLSAAVAAGRFPTGAVAACR